MQSSTAGFLRDPSFAVVVLLETTESTSGNSRKARFAVGDTLFFFLNAMTIKPITRYRHRWWLRGRGRGDAIFVVAMAEC